MQLKSLKCKYVAQNPLKISLHDTSKAIKKKKKKSLSKQYRLHFEASSWEQGVSFVLFIMKIKI